MGLASLKVTVSGRVQGVNFRDFTRREAEALGLTGYVRNLPGGEGVEVVAEGERVALQSLLDIVGRGPPRATVETVLPVWEEHTGQFKEFKIRY